MKGLTDFGPRVAGSYENEVLAVNYLEGIIQNIIAEKNEVQIIEYDIGTVTGSYYLGYKPYGSINAYANLQNIVIKVHGSNSLNSVLINSHFDTVIGSPGNVKFCFSLLALSFFIFETLHLLYRMSNE